MSLVRQARCNTYPSELVPSVWESVKPLIERALKRGSNYTIEQIHAGLLEKAMQLFVWESDKIHAALVTTIQNRDEQRWCLLLAIGGEKMRVYGRPGWARVTGYNLEYCKLVKEL